MAKKITWLTEPEAQDYPAAQDYLELLCPPSAAATLVQALRSAPPTYKKAKDILRASKLQKLPRDNVHVAKDVKKIKDGQPLSPILLVSRDHHLIVADGYHRVCAVHELDEDAEIPCRLVYG